MAWHLQFQEAKLSRRPPIAFVGICAGRDLAAHDSRESHDPTPRRNPVLTASGAAAAPMQGRSRSCNRIFVALEDCQRKHPRQSEVCEQLNKAAAWCAVRELCPSEGGGLHRGCQGLLPLQGMCVEGLKLLFKAVSTPLDGCVRACTRAHAHVRLGGSLPP